MQVEILPGVGNAAHADPALRDAPVCPENFLNGGSQTRVGRGMGKNGAGRSIEGGKGHIPIKRDDCTMIHLLDLLVHPERFFSTLEGKEPDLKIPAAIALAGAVVAAVAGYAQSSLFADMFAEMGAGAGMGAFMGIMGAAGAFLGFLIIWWLVMAGVFHVISMAFKGTGKFTRTLESTGYGLLPTVIGSIISTLILFSYLPRIAVPVVRDLQDPVAIQKAMQELMLDPAMKEFTQVSIAISILFLIWSANIWIFGVRQARGITLKHACITVIIPVAVYILYMVYMLVSGIPLPGGA
ncbi:MAG: Yip1 domain protein [Methanoregulaceae archaeon PtaU1.Bin059]|nr:MAG: Yip1 domain protein [Methanoregulaceae archaeon PtaB.Bin009]OPY41050.1 MAG: Yip1 domain protein [Methanoregulaceae archaeon PtaU1.Bin059]